MRVDKIKLTFGYCLLYFGRETAFGIQVVWNYWAAHPVRIERPKRSGQVTA